jgi:hypothetical protein
MRPTFLRALLIAIGVLLGVVITILVENYCPLSFDPKISLGELVNAFATVFAALAVTVLVTFYLEKHNQTNRKEKDLLMRQLDFIFQLVQEFEKSNEIGELTKITASHKQLSTANSLFYKILSEFKYPKNVLIETDIGDPIHEIWKLATDTPIRDIEEHAKHSRCGASVKNGIITLAKERRDLLEVKINDIKSKIFKAQLAINRS